MNNSPVCKCAVPNLKQLSYRDYCQTCGGFPLPKEVKCCEKCEFSEDTKWKRVPCLHCPCHSPNMDEVMGKGFDYRDANAGKSPHPDFKDLNGVAPNTEVMRKVYEDGGITDERYAKIKIKKAPNTEENWEEEFDEKFGVIPENVIPFSEQYSAEDFKSFIRSLLLSEKNKVREEVIEIGIAELEYAKQEGRNEAVYYILEKLPEPTERAPHLAPIRKLVESARSGKV